MNIYFCEKCGVRLTSVDIEQGRGSKTDDGKTYCQPCAKDATQAAQPTLIKPPSSTAIVKKDSARNIQPVSPRTSARGIPAATRRDSGSIATPPPASSASSKLHQTKATVPAAVASKPNWAVIGGVAAVVALVVVTIGVLATRNPSADKQVSVPEQKEAPPRPRETPPASNDNPPDGTKPPRGIDVSADEEFFRLVKFEGLKPDDKAGRIAALEEYLAAHPESKNSARANLYLMDLRNTEPVRTQAPLPSEAPPPPTTVVASVTPPKPTPTPAKPKPAPAVKTPPPAPPQPAVKEPVKEVAVAESPEKTKLAGVRNDLAPLLHDFHFSAALELLEGRMPEPGLADISDLLQKEKADLADIVTLRQHAIDAMRQIKDKNLTLRMGKMTITGKPIEDAGTTGLKFKLTEGPEMTINIDDLEPTDIETYAPLPTGAERVDELRRRGLLFLAVKDLVKAREYFKYAQAAGSDSAATYLKRIDDLEADELDARARQEWAPVEALVIGKHWNEANAALTAFKSKFLKTKAFAQLEEQFNKRLKDVELGLRPYVEGLVGVYYKDRDFNESKILLTRVDSKIDIVLTPGKSPAKEVPSTNYCVRWEGALRISTNGRYNFALHLDDGGRLWIDGKAVIDDWKDGGNHKVTGQADLAEGFHELKVEYFQATGPAVCKLAWSLKNAFPEGVIPPEAFWHPPKDLPKK